MARDKIKGKVLAKFLDIQEGHREPVWMSGLQITQLVDGNPSSIRMALLLLHEDGELNRERRKGRGKTGKTGQSAWYSLNGDRGQK